MNLSRSFLSSRASDQTIGSVQPCFSANWATVKPLDKSAFIRFANTGISNNSHALAGTTKHETLEKIVKWS